MTDSMAPEPEPEPEPGPEPRSDPPSPPSQPSGNDTTSILVDAHNRVRAAHCAPPLAWSAQLAKVAQGWADKLRDAGCAFEHSRTRYGENLAAGTAGALDAGSVVEMWYREVDQYDFKRAAFSMDTGHFTQVVWVGTTKLGCGVASCKGMEIWVCNYDPPGNVQTLYRRNVLPTSCKK
jgi:uncharacterized protein YkwD